MYKVLRLLPDKLYLQLIYYYHFKKFINFKNPTGFNEKIQWLKIHDKNEKYVDMVDKFMAKEYVANIIGRQYINPTIGVWNDVDEIDFEKLPRSFVLKCNHDSGGLVICKDKEDLNIEQAKRKLKSALKNNGYWYGREWPYKNVPPKIIAEPYLVDELTGELRDYKFFCFNGEVKAMFIGSGRHSKEGVKFDFFDADFNRLDFTNGHPNSDIDIKRPVCFDEMKDRAKDLSKGIPFVRVDFYEVNKKVYFGEITLYHGSGLLPFNPPEWDKVFGDWLNLSVVKK